MRILQNLFMFGLAGQVGIFKMWDNAEWDVDSVQAEATQRREKEG